MQENSPTAMPETKNKTFVIVSAILLLSIAVIIAVFFNKNQKNQEPDQEIVVQQEEVVDQNLNQEGAALLFADLIAKKEGNFVCQIENGEDFYTYYFNDKRLAIEVKVPNSHTRTIVDADFTYNWDVIEKVGTKFSTQEDVIETDLNQASDVTDEEAVEEIPEEDLLPAEDVGPFDPANFVCREWELDEAVFTPPTDVIFQDLSSIQKQMMDLAQ